MGRLRIGVVAGVDIEAVDLPTPGGHDVEHLAGGGRRHHGVRGVDGTSLRSMRRHGVPQLDMFTRVGGGQDDLAGAFEPSDGHRSTQVYPGHGPRVAVANPLPPGAEAPVVVAGYDLVADAGGGPTGDGHTVFVDMAGGHPVGPGSGIELTHGDEVPGDHQAARTGLGVALPRSVEGVEHLVSRARGDPVVGLVVVDGVGRAGSQGDTCLLLPVVMEPAHVGELADQIAAVTNQGGKHPARFDCTELGVIACQEDLGPGAFGRGPELVEGERPGQTGFVHDDELALAKAPTGQFDLGDSGVWALPSPPMLEEPLGDVLRLDPEFGGQHLGRGGRRGQPAHRTRSVCALPDRPQSRHGGGFARPGGADEQVERSTRRSDLADGRNLVGSQ